MRPTETVLKYEQIPENKDKKRRQARIGLLRSYGLTERDFLDMLERQRYRCLGCLDPITEDTARIDHDHDRGKAKGVRGLLCNHCNWTLSHSNNRADVLRRLTAYIHPHYDRTKVNIYLIGALKNPAIQAAAKQLRQAGYNIWDEWHGAGPEADEWWQKYEEARGRTYQEALAGLHAQDVFLFDRVHLDLADCAILLMPAGKSGHLELGYFAGTGKPAFILLDEEPKRYDVMPNFATVCYSMAELIEKLSKQRWLNPRRQ